ncbi:hypothetical protein [Sterolibacterium denitrificans]|nr:hypothetical protein [Sterolibacterium denitrificans]
MKAKALNEPDGVNDAGGLVSPASISTNTCKHKNSDDEDFIP